jgi:4-diphosphocytidyl-2-C-methyl-D-erythritol kinase
MQAFNMLLQAPAKINLTLEVLARRADGYHGVRSLMVPLELADELAIEPSDQFSFKCSRRELEGERNLAVAALRALGELPRMRVELRKRIPVQAGLGGGSSDAAAILRAAMEGAFGPLPHYDWMRVARTLGSDVPFFLAGTAALVEGTGERVTPAGALPPWHVVIVKPPVDVSTAQAYQALDALDHPQRPRNGSVSITALEAFQRADFDRVESLMQNDFHDLTVSRTPEVRAAVEALAAAGARKALLAGSGSSVFTLVRDRADANAILVALALGDSYERYACGFATTPSWRAS